MKRLSSIVKLGLIGAILTVTFSGCTAMTTAIKKRNLDVQTKMSETIFLEPVSPSKRVVYVDIRNTSDKDLNITESIKEKIKKSGYTITDNPDKAHFMLQANVLQVEKSDLGTAESALNAGFGGAVIGGTIGAIAGSHSTPYGYRNINSRGAMIGAMWGWLVDTISGAMVKDIVYVMITDLQLKERPQEGEIIKQTQNTSATSGTATRVNQTVSGGNPKWKIYRTRIVSTANKVNLSFEDAQATLENGLTKSIGGIF